MEIGLNGDPGVHAWQFLAKGRRVIRLEVVPVQIHSLGLEAACVLAVVLKYRSASTIMDVQVRMHSEAKSYANH